MGAVHRLALGGTSAIWPRVYPSTGGAGAERGRRSRTVAARWMRCAAGGAPVQTNEVGRSRALASDSVAGRGDRAAPAAARGRRERGAQPALGRRSATAPARCRVRRARSPVDFGTSSEGDAPSLLAHGWRWPSVPGATPGRWTPRPRTACSRCVRTSGRPDRLGCGCSTARCRVPPRCRRRWSARTRRVAVRRPAEPVAARGRAGWRLPLDRHAVRGGVEVRDGVFGVAAGRAARRSRAASDGARVRSSSARSRAGLVVAEQQAEQGLFEVGGIVGRLTGYAGEALELVHPLCRAPGRSGTTRPCLIVGLPERQKNTLGMGSDGAASR